MSPFSHLACFVSHWLHRSIPSFSQGTRSFGRWRLNTLVPSVPQRDQRRAQEIPCRNIEKTRGFFISQFHVPSRERSHIPTKREKENHQKCWLVGEALVGRRVTLITQINFGFLGSSNRCRIYLRCGEFQVEVLLHQYATNGLNFHCYYQIRTQVSVLDYIQSTNSSLAGTCPPGFPTEKFASTNIYIYI